MPGRGHRIMPRDLPPQPRTRTPLDGRARPGLVRHRRGCRPPRVRPVPLPDHVHRSAGRRASRGDRRSLTLRGHGSVAHALPWDRLRPIIERESAHLGRAIPPRSAPRA